MISFQLIFLRRYKRDESRTSFRLSAWWLSFTWTKIESWMHDCSPLGINYIWHSKALIETKLENQKFFLIFESAAQRPTTITDTLSNYGTTRAIPAPRRAATRGKRTRNALTTSDRGLCMPMWCWLLACSVSLRRSFGVWNLRGADAFKEGDEFILFFLCLVMTVRRPDRLVAVVVVVTGGMVGQGVRT